MGANGVFVMGDCGLNQNPNPTQLADIAASSAESFEYLVGEKARVAMLSHSSYGSAAHNDVDKVVEATAIAKKEYPQFLIDGELQTDAALIPEIAEFKHREVLLQEKLMFWFSLIWMQEISVINYYRD